LFRLATIVFVAALCACGGDDTPPIEYDAGPAFNGGTITPPGCSYELTTSASTTEPALSTDAVGDNPDPRDIHLGIAGDPSTSMVISWRTRDATTEKAEVRWGRVDLDESAQAITWLYRDREPLPARAHEVHLCGLEPDTEYGYKVISGDVESPEYRFRTAPDPAADPMPEVVFLILGDTRGGPEVFGALLADGLAHSPDLILYTGDMVAEGDTRAHWDSFFGAAGENLATVPLVGTVGNHEEGAISYFSLWPMPGDEHWFSLDYGSAHIAVADDASTIFPDQDGRGEAFLDADLAEAQGQLTWRMVMHHQPIFTSESAQGHGRTERLVENWLPVFVQHDVHFAFNGHDHKYERTLTMDGENVSADQDDGTIYVVTGGAGAPLYDAPSESFTATAESVFHYVIARVRPLLVELTAYDINGNVIDLVTRGRPITMD
jgi:hypothetical protein